MSHLNRLVKLNYLGLKLVVSLELVLKYRCINMMLQNVVLLLALIRGREQIRDDPIELIDVFVDELGDVADGDGAEDGNIFTLLGW